MKGSVRPRQTIPWKEFNARYPKANQILLLTHEQGFFELVASDVKSKGWLLQDFKWSKENGVGIVEGITDIKERILKKFEAKDKEGLVSCQVRSDARLRSNFTCLQGTTEGA